MLQFLFPNRCILCSKVVRGEAALCANCAKKPMLLANKRICKKCSRPVAEGEFLCPNCQVHPHYFTACFATAVYEGELRRSILRYKFYNRPEYHRGYAQLILSHLSGFDALPRFDAVIGAPLSKERLRERGYNQSEVIAKVVAKTLGIPFIKDGVTKLRHTVAQSSLSYDARRKNLRGAFRVAKPEAFRGKIVLLIDDVLTTGATADEISRVLLKAGTKSVYIAVVAIANEK